MINASTFQIRALARILKNSHFYAKNANFLHFRGTRKCKRGAKLALDLRPKAPDPAGRVQGQDPQNYPFSRKVFKNPRKIRPWHTFWPKSVHLNAKMPHFWVIFDPQMFPKSGLNPSLKKF